MTHPPRHFPALLACLMLSMIAVQTRGQLTDPAGFGDAFGAPDATSGSGAREPVVKFDTRWQGEAIAADSEGALAIELDIDPRYHIQLHKPQLDYLVPTDVKVTGLPAGVLVSGVRYPEPHPIVVDFGEGPQKLDFYAGKAAIVVSLHVGPSVAPGKYDLEAATTWQACDDKTCLQPQTTISKVTLTVAPAGTNIAESHDAPFDVLRQPIADVPAGANTLNIPLFGYDFSIDPTKLWLLLLIAFIGGFLLNFTPCVLPLIPIKIMGLSAAAGHRSRCLMLGAVMSGGVVFLWLALGIAIATVSGFTATNQLFQKPWFTIGVGVIIAIMAAGMCGLFAVRLPQKVYMFNPSHDTAFGSFLFGIMTAVLSTPCTAPFMGAAAAWAATQNPAVTLSTFAAIGSGMAFPYLLLSAYPKLIDRMPRTGPASELIKQVMGLFMLAAAAFFVGTGVSGLIVTPPDPPTLAYWYFVGAFIIAAGTWLTWRTIALRPKHRANLITFVLIGLLFIGAGAHLAYWYTRHGPVNWVYYTPERLENAKKDGKFIVLEFTAQWCLNCHALEHAVLFDPRVTAALNSNKVVPIKVDLTGDDNGPGNALLTQQGRRSIPLLVIYAPDGKVVFESDAYTVSQVLEALK